MSKINCCSILSLNPDNHFYSHQWREKEKGIFPSLSMIHIETGENGTAVAKNKHTF